MLIGNFLLAGLGNVTVFAQDAATSGTATYTLPAGIQDGDLIVIMEYASGFSLPALVVPAGYTQALTAPFGTIRLTMLYKIAVAADAGATITLMSGLSMIRHIQVFRAEAPISGVTSSGGDPSAQVVATVADPAPQIVIGAYGTVGLTGRSMAPTEDFIAALANSAMACKIFNSSPAAVTVDLGDGGDGNVLASFRLSLI